MNISTDPIIGKVGHSDIENYFVVTINQSDWVVVLLVVVLGFDVPPTTKVIYGVGRNFGFKSNSKNWRRLGSNIRFLIY